MNIFRAVDKEFPLKRTYIMGILNVTPDSFSDGGRYMSLDEAVARAVELESQGADIIDVGGQSTRPGAELISPREEWSRLEKVLPAIVKSTSLAVSVDTFYPWVARKALEAGAHIINDVSGFGKEMLETVKGSGCGCVAMFPAGAGGGHILTAVRGFFQNFMAAANACGIEECRLCLDPGIGFGKSYEENLELIANVQRVKIPGVGFLMAASRKRVTGIPCGNPPFEQRLAATLAAHTAAILGGADFVRVHDVKEALQAAQMADALKGCLAGKDKTDEG